MVDRGFVTPLELGPGQLLCRRSRSIRSYDHRGVVFSWEPPAGMKFRRAAIDVEAFDAPSVQYFSNRFALSDRTFLRRWTATEVLAKVLNVPILALLKGAGLSEEVTEQWTEAQPGVWMLTIEHPTHQVTVGVLL